MALRKSTAKFEAIWRCPGSSPSASPDDEAARIPRRPRTQYTRKYTVKWSDEMEGRNGGTKWSASKRAGEQVAETKLASDFRKYTTH